MTTLKRIGFESARIATMVAIALLVVKFLVNLSLAPGLAPLLAEMWTPNITWTVEATRAAVIRLGWTATTPVLIFLALQALVGGLTCAVGLLILANKHRTGLGLFMALTLVLQGTIGTASDPLMIVFPVLTDLLNLLGAISWQLSFIVLHLFPDGRFVPRWTAWLLPAWAVANVLAYGSGAGTILLLPMTLMTILIFIAVGSQVYRYFRRADAISRQQTKWIVYGVMVLGLMLPFAMLPFVVPGLFDKTTGEGLVWAIAVRASSTVAALLFPVTIAIAVLRYRLWDIDVILRRTVTYAIVSGALAIVYFGANIVAQGVIGALGGQRNEVAIVASTLAVAALFSPVRRRVQNGIDRRFNRQRYDADKVIADFAEYAAHETDLAALQARIVGVVAETIQPRQVSLWVRETPQRTQPKVNS